MHKLTRLPKADVKDILYVDPGFHTGLFQWVSLSQCFLWTQLDLPNKVKDDVPRLVIMWQNFLAIIDDWEPKQVVVEDVFLRPGDPKSMGSALRGNLLLLDKLAAGYCALALSREIPFSLIKAHKWKGQMNDTAVRSRVKLISGLEFESEHVTDACGMSLHGMGIFA